MARIWSGWIIISRYGVHTDLQPADITLLRYWTALLTAATFAARCHWRLFRLWQYLVVGLGVGFPYTMLSCYGLTIVRAAHAGVVVNGLLPILGATALPGCCSDNSLRPPLCRHRLDFHRQFCHDRRFDPDA
ncbi:MAG: hypothetical protein FWF31_11140 [Desulfobulbus sp.]|nr:hypothetical protein [Desulfobulbus sp.]